MLKSFSQQCCIWLLLLLASLGSSAVNAAVVDQLTTDDVAYFLYQSPNKIERYDLANAQALDPISLAKAPTAFTVHKGTAYVAYGRELRTLNLADGQTTFLRNFSHPVKQLGANAKALYVVTGDSSDSVIYAIDTNDTEVIDEHGLFRAITDLIVTEGHLHYTTRNFSSIYQVELSQAGGFGNETGSNHHFSSNSENSKFWLSDDQKRIVHSSGGVYYGDGLDLAGNLNGTIDTVTYIDSNPVIARNNALQVFTHYLVGVETLPLASTPGFITSHEREVFAFSFSEDSYSLEVIDVSALTLPAAGEVLAEATTQFTVDLFAHDDQDIVYLADESFLTIFRWSTSQQTFLSNWYLASPPRSIAYSKAHNRLYINYRNGQITYFDSQSESAGEQTFVSRNVDDASIAVIGDFLFAGTDDAFSSDPSAIYDIDGNEVSTTSNHFSTPQVIWAPSSQRLFFNSSSFVRWLEIDPANGTFVTDSNGFSSSFRDPWPLWPHPTNNTILTSDGALLDGATLLQENALSNDIYDAAWVADQLITVDPQQRHLQIWGDNYELLSEIDVTGIGLSAIEPMASKLLLIGEQNGQALIQLTALDEDGDSDTITDLMDNCPSVSNQNQLNFDNDLYGDACDTDSDNDGLLNELETANGLNPLDAADAAFDADEDGFSNRAELLAGTDLNDSASTPTPVTQFIETFNDGWPSGFFSTLGRAKIDSLGFTGSPALFIPPSSVASVGFTQVFSKGVLSAALMSDAEWHEGENFVVYVDGVEAQRVNRVENEDIRFFRIELEAGEHTITFASENDGSFNREGFGTYLDDLIFGQDAEQDGVLDQIDNCPLELNPWQTDSDGDGIGDDCDIYPNEFNSPPDSDEDGIADHRDNCPLNANSDQTDIDGDLQGDACDPRDDRPVDSDNDGRQDSRDNCPLIANPDQEDLDFDGIGDACDDIDDRPKDTDNDNWEDIFDNCPLIANPEQQDLDGDQQGDVCDSDIDGDGISNDLEEATSFLDPRNATDAWLDEDNDGASNVYEINQGNDPASPDTYARINLTSYAVGPDGRYIFVREGATPDAAHEFYIQDQFYLPELDSYLFSEGSQHFEVAQREQGLELLSSGQFGAFVHQNDILLPASLSEGGALVIEDVYRGGSRFNQFDPSTSTKIIRWVDKGTFEFNGEHYPSVTVAAKYSDQFSVFDTVRQETYAQGLGLVAFNGYRLTRIVSLDTNEDVVVSPADEKIVDGDESNGPQAAPASKKSGGSLGFWYLIALSAIFAIRRSAAK